MPTCKNWVQISHHFYINVIFSWFYLKIAFSLPKNFEHVFFHVWRFSCCGIFQRGKAKSCGRGQASLGLTAREVAIIFIVTAVCTWMIFSDKGYLCLSLLFAFRDFSLVFVLLCFAHAQESGAQWFWAELCEASYLSSSPHFPIPGWNSVTDGTHWGCIMQKPISVQTPSVCVEGHHLGPAPEQCQKCFTPLSPLFVPHRLRFWLGRLLWSRSRAWICKIEISNAAMPVVGTSRPVGFDGTIQLCKLK